MPIDFGEMRKREEKYQFSVPHTYPCRGPNPQTRHVPGQWSEPVTFLFAGWCPMEPHQPGLKTLCLDTHWLLLFIVGLLSNPLGLLQHLSFRCLLPPYHRLSLPKSLFLTGLKNHHTWLLWLNGLSTGCEPKGLWFDSQSVHMPRLWVRSPVGGMWEVTTHWCFSPCLPPSLPLFLKNK